MVDIVRDELQEGRALDSAVLAKIDGKWSEIEKALPEKVNSRVEEKWVQISVDDGALDRKIRDTIVRKARSYWTMATFILGFLGVSISIGLLGYTYTWITNSSKLTKIAEEIYRLEKKDTSLVQSEILKVKSEITTQHVLAKKQIENLLKDVEESAERVKEIVKEAGKSKIEADIQFIPLQEKFNALKRELDEKEMKFSQIYSEWTRVSNEIQLATKNLDLTGAEAQYDQIMEELVGKIGIVEATKQIRQLRFTVSPDEAVLRYDGCEKDSSLTEIARWNVNVLDPSSKRNQFVLCLRVTRSFEKEPPAK